MKFSAVVAIGVLQSAMLMAQAPDLPQYNPNSVNPIARYEQLFRVRVWRELDLNEKQNEGFFSKNGEISALIIKAVKSGEIPAVYDSDSLTTVKSKESFLQELTATKAATFDAWTPSASYLTGEIVTYNGSNYEARSDNSGKNPEKSADDWEKTTQGKASEYLPSMITTMQFMEDVIFDRRRSRLYYDVQAIQLVVPAKNTTEQVVNKNLGWIKFKDLEKVFRAHPREAVWFNRQNTAESKNFADAFLLRLFRASIYKVGNPDDSSLSEIYSENNRPYKESVWAREWEEIRLMEKEHNLWEY